MSNGSTPTGYAPDGPPVLFTDPAPNRAQASTTFTPATPVSKKITPVSTQGPANDVPTVGAGTTFTKITAPQNHVMAPAATQGPLNDTPTVTLVTTSNPSDTVD